LTHTGKGRTIETGSKGRNGATEKGKANESYYIGNYIQRPLKDYVIEMKEAVASNSELEFGKVINHTIPLEYNEFDTKKLAELGFEPRISFREGIIYTRDWMLSVSNE